MSEEDRALEVLAATYKKLAPEVPLSLVKKCYEIEKQFLFETDRNKPIEVLSALVENYVETIAEKGASDEAA